MFKRLLNDIAFLVDKEKKLSSTIRKIRVKNDNSDGIADRR